MRVSPSRPQPEKFSLAPKAKGLKDVSASWMFRYLLEAVSWTLPEIVNSPAVASAATTADVPSILSCLEGDDGVGNRSIGALGGMEETYPFLLGGISGIWDR